MLVKQPSILIGLILCWAFCLMTYADAGESYRRWPFFAFRNGLGDLTYEDQADLLKKLGYDGAEFGGNPAQIPDMLKALNARGLKIYTVYLAANVDPDKPSYEPGLEQAVQSLKGRGAILAIHIEGGTPSATDSDDRAVAIVRHIADLAEPAGLRVAIYPHVGHYIARFSDAIRLVKKVDRSSVGVCFNLCHFLKLDDESQMEQQLKESMPHLFVVNINGADAGDTKAMDWSRLIQTLDCGSFDVYHVLEILDRMGYEGPVGLQCYNIPGVPCQNLERSIDAWDGMNDCLKTRNSIGFQPISNGKDLTGWEGEPGYWTVEDGAITATTTAEKPLDHASYLYWRGGKPANFELHAKYRFTTPDGNSGINFRSRELPNWDIKGYQADMEMGPSYSGIFYECNDRGIMTERGQKLIVAEDGSRQVTVLASAEELQKHIHPNDWNDYVIIAKGPEIILKINGVVTVHVIDREKDKAAASGLISLQAHPGPPCRIQFKDISIKNLP